MLVHQAASGCNLAPGDILGSGTCSGPTDETKGCLLEASMNGKVSLTLKDGLKRGYLEDGDTVVMEGWCDNGKVKIGFGQCVGKVLPAVPFRA